jgi:protocatechuate 3,4-dioxygenase beta subunit
MNIPDKSHFGDPEIHRLKNLLVHGHVYKEDCSTPIPHVRMEIWQADHEGNYKMSADCRGHFKTDKHGYYEITTIHPGKYSVDTRYSLYRPIHLHFKVFGRRRHKSLVTQMYFAGDSHLGRNDSCQVCSSDREDLIIETSCLHDPPARSPFGHGGSVCYNPLYTRDHEQEDFSNDEFQDPPCKTVVVSVVLENNMVQ